MAKANKNVRKRSRVKEKGIQKVESKTKPDIRPINSQEVMYFNQLIEISNAYSKSRQQYSQYELALRALETNRKKIKKGEYTVLNVPVAPDTTTALTDKKEMLKYLDKQIVQLRTALTGIKGQLDNKRDIFIEVGLRTEAFIVKRFAGYRVKKVASDGTRANEEKVLFEAEYEELVKKEGMNKKDKERVTKKQAEFKKVLAVAKKA